MTRNNRAVGTAYEALAGSYLEGEGYRILSRNYKRPTGEIDLIAREGDILVFIEVKYRKSAGKGTPEAAVGPGKQKRIYRTAQYYLAENRIPDSHPCRFDVVAIEGEKIRLYRGAFGGF